MLMSEYRLAKQIIAKWQGYRIVDVDFNPCPLLSDLDRFLDYTTEANHRPGQALWPCHICGENHGWSFLYELIEGALKLRPDSQNHLVRYATERRAEIATLYGGEDKLANFDEGRANFLGRMVPNKDHNPQS